MTPRVNTEDLVDAQEVADLLGLSHRNTVSTYQRRYADMPRPVVDLGPGRPMLWVRQEVQAWARLRRQS
jgi:predicted DNA-binding transcriptional regulator AlpA